jgi:glycosyltransferase involved in cell wall biosynthesis
MAADQTIIERSPGLSSMLGQTPPDRYSTNVRVLHLTSSFPRDARDHVAPFLLDLLHAEQDAGLDVAVLTPHDSNLPMRETIAGIEVHRFRYGPASMERLSYRGGLLGSSRRVGGLMLPAYLGAFKLAAERAARELKPDVLHAHWWLPAGLCALPAARKLDIPLVVTIHGSDAHLLRYSPLRKLAAHVMHKASLVAVVSEDLRRQVEEIDPRLPTAVLRLPVHADVPVAPMPTDPPLRLLAAGRLSPEKGFDVLIEAMRIAVGHGLDVSLDIVGSGPERRRLAALAAPLGDRIRLIPALAHADLLRRMDDVHALVAPSRREGLGMVALEAFTRGRPVIASRVGGLAESVEDGIDGYLVPVGDPVALAAAIARLPLNPPIGAAVHRHSPAEVGRTHMEAYASLVTGMVRAR